MKTRIAAVVATAAILLTGCTASTGEEQTEMFGASESAYLSRVRDHQPQRSANELVAGGRAPAPR